MITEKDLPVPDDSKFLDKNGNLKPYTPPVLIHSVDADYVDPYTKHPFVEMARVSVVVGTNGEPKEAGSHGDWRSAPTKRPVRQSCSIALFLPPCTECPSKLEPMFRSPL